MNFEGFRRVVAARFGADTDGRLHLLHGASEEVKVFN